MTALEQYIRLEAIGHWRESPEAGPREVIVSFGNATLMLREGDDTALAHWALSATHVVEGNDDGAVYSPDGDTRETLYISDREMIDAIARVTAAGRRRPRGGGRRNRLVALLVVLALAAAAVALGPEIFKTYTAHNVSQLTRNGIAASILQEIAELRGPPCATPASEPVFRRLAERILPGHPPAIAVVPLAGGASASLPGGLVLLDPATLERAATPEELAGWIVEESLRAERAPPLSELLRNQPLQATVTLLTTGRLPDALVAEAAAGAGSGGVEADETLDARLLERLERAGLPSLPFATAVARDGGSIDRVRRLRAGNTLPVEKPFEPALSDQDWLVLKGVCDR